MVDVAQQKGLEIDLALLAERLKVPVLPVIGSTGGRVWAASRRNIQAGGGGQTDPANPGRSGGKLWFRR